MLYFCSVDDIKGVMQSAARYDDEYNRVRKAVTEDMNAYMRRVLHYETDITEVFDTHDVEFGGSFTVWLGKKRIDTSLPVIAQYNNRRLFEDDNVIPGDNLLIESEKGKITAYSMTRAGRGSFRVKYSGGYKARTPESDVMDCPETLYSAALGECVYRLDKLLNINVGNSDDSNGRSKSPQRKLIGNLLWDTAMALTPYRKPLGTI